MPETIDEGLERIHRWGPEFDGRLSNHGPMVLEAMVRRGHQDEVGRWLDSYEKILEPAPRARQPISRRTWRAARGDPDRLGDWLAFFDNELLDAPWQDVLARWWPELLPGLAASATHSVIRLGHSVRTLREEGETDPRLAEFAASLAYWAGRWLPVPDGMRATQSVDVAGSLVSLPALGKSGPFPDLLLALGEDHQWQVGAGPDLPDSPDEVRVQLQELVTAATVRYRTHGHGDPIMLVHAVTAPNAVLRLLPSLPRDLWRPSLRAAWLASAAVTAIYNPTIERPWRPKNQSRAVDPADIFDRAVSHGDEHVIKFADTALDVHEWTHRSAVLDAAELAAELIDQE
jgi:hypothetical protein